MGLRSVAGDERVGVLDELHLDGRDRFAGVDVNVDDDDGPGMD